MPDRNRLLFMKKYYVTVNWSTTLGNPTTKSTYIMANDESEAMSKLRERVSKYKKCWKTQGGSAVESK